MLILRELNSEKKKAQKTPHPTSYILELRTTASRASRLSQPIGSGIRRRRGIPRTAMRLSARSSVNTFAIFLFFAGDAIRRIHSFAIIVSSFATYTEHGRCENVRPFHPFMKIPQDPSPTPYPACHLIPSVAFVAFAGAGERLLRAEAYKHIEH